MSEEKQENKEKTENPLDKYQDAYGVSTRSLNFGLWFIEHKVKIRAAIAVLLIVISLVFWGYSLISLISYLNTGRAEDEAMIAGITEQILIGHDQIKAMSASPLNIGDFNYFRNTNDKIDFYARVSNPNVNYVARFEYCYFSGSEKVKCGSNFVLPNEDKYCLDLNNEIIGVQDFTFEILSTSWSLVNRHEIPDWEAYKSLRSSFHVSGIEKNLENSEQNLPNSANLSFSIKNNSPYDFRQVPLNLIFYRGGSLFAVNRIVLENFLFDEERLVSLALPNGQSYSSEVDIIPDLDIFDDSNYRKPTGNTGFIK